MGILLAFMPFFAFFVVIRLAGVVPGLVAGTVVAAALLVRDAITPNRAVKVLEIGTVLLFAGLMVYAMTRGATWTVAAVRLRVDVGLLLVVLASMAIRRPFTLQYAREQVSREYWDAPQFVRVNYVITAVWAAAFAAMVAADLLLVYATNLPKAVGVIATVAAIWGAAKFTAWYPEHAGSAASTARG